MKKQIPAKLEKKLLEAYQVSGEEIVMVAVADLDEAYRFTDQYLILTNNRLFLAAYPWKVGRTFSFGGYEAKSEQSDHTEEPIVRVLELMDIEELKIIRNISGGTLLYIEKGADMELVQFTNSKMAQMDRLKKVVDKIKRGEEVTKEDIEGSRQREYCPKCGSLYPDQERKVCPKCMDKKSVLFRIARYFLPYWRRMIVMGVCYVGTAVLNLVYPYLSGTILYDYVLKKNPAVLEILGLRAGRFALALLVLVLGMFVSKVMIQLLGIIQGILTAKTVPEVVATIKGEIFTSMGKLSISFFNNRQTGGLMARVSDDADEVTGFFIDGVPYFFINTFTVIATVIIMFRLNPLLAAVSVILLPWLTVGSYNMLPKLWNAYGKRHRANRKLKGQINDNFTGARVVKAFGQEESELGRFGKNNGAVKKAEQGVASYDNKFYLLYTATERAVSLLVWGVGAALILGTSDIELGLLITFTGYVSQLNGPLDFFSHLFRWYTNSMNCAQRIFEIIDAVPEVREAETPVRPDILRGDIELKHVTFGYEPHKPILKNVSFSIKAGQVLGIVGKSGAGKTTLVNLISRLYDPDEGEIYIDGVNVKELGFRQLRSSIGIVSQETYIFMGTVAENIAYAKPDASREEIIRAAIQASAHDFICKMPEGYDTMLGSSGKSLSGGERQRISIARAILANPSILILDEATSAVDTETELAIQESLEKLIQGRTALSIAHRLSTLRNADSLIVIENGEVKESGTHQELLEQKGIFYRLTKLQEKALAMRGLE